VRDSKNHNTKKRTQFRNEILKGWRRSDLVMIFAGNYKTPIAQNFLKCIKMVVPYSKTTYNEDIFRSMKRLYEHQNLQEQKGQTLAMALCRHRPAGENQNN